jgi:hypothetical protein
LLSAVSRKNAKVRPSGEIVALEAFGSTSSGRPPAALIDHSPMESSACEW